MSQRKAGSGRQRPSSGNQRKTVRQPAKAHRRKLVWFGTLGTAAITVVTGVLVNVLSNQAQRVVALPSSAPVSSAQVSEKPQLEVDGVSLTSGGTQQDGTNQPAPFKIDIKLLNNGNGIAAINDARLIIQKYAVLAQCASQGGFTSTGTYRSNLPINPKPEQVVDIPISQLVPSNGADRFDLLLKGPLVQAWTVDKSNRGPNVYLYRVHLYLTYNVNTKPLNIGEILVDSPLSPNAGQYYWDSYYAAHPEIISGAVYGPDIPEYKRCAIKNSETLRSMLSPPSIRPANLATILPQLRYA